MQITVDFKETGYTLEDLSILKPEVTRAHKTLHNGSGLGNDYIGWLDYPKNYDKEEFLRIKESAKRINSNSDILLVIGIGGSYLGAMAGLKALNDSFYDLKSDNTKIYFVGNHLSSKEFTSLLKIIENRDISINVISKSGTTTEPAIAFRILRSYLVEKYGKEEAAKRIYVTTDENKGALRKLCQSEGYENFIIPGDVGGRYSVFTPVGLLPMAVSGIDIDDLMSGALDAFEEYSNLDVTKNHCYQYAVLRNLLLRRGKNLELLVSYEPSLFFLSEWWKQLYGESEGKDGKGLYPSSAMYTTDLHSLGQYVQGGQRFLFETVLNIENNSEDIFLEYDESNLDNLNYLEGKGLNHINKMAMQGTLRAHVDGGVPNIVISIPEMTPYYLGKLLYFFMKACGISGYILDVNPFNQPGVEDYKKNMFALLDKPGFEELRQKLLEKESVCS